MRMALMLSMPYWLPLSLETSSSSSSSTMLCEGSYLAMRFLTHSTIQLFDLTYHIPSHPIIIKSTFQFFIFSTSGKAVIAWSSGRTAAFLYYKSPKALDKFNPPLTLPQDTLLPALVILSSSVGSSGLWSLLSSTASPPTQATALESPALAQYMNSGVMSTTLAVHPACESSSYLGPFSLSFINFWMAMISYLPDCPPSITSILRKVYLSAYSYLLSWQFLLAYSS